MKFLDPSFNTMWDNSTSTNTHQRRPSHQRRSPSHRRAHQTRFWPPPPTPPPPPSPPKKGKYLIEHFEEIVDSDSPSLEDCGHAQNCAKCKEWLDGKLREHWSYKITELKNDVLEFLGLICFGVFIIVLVDLLLNFKGL